MIKSCMMKDLIERVSHSLAEIVVLTPQGPEKLGTGFVISPNGLLATCLHVLDGSPEYHVQLFGEPKPHRAALVQQETSHDLAVLSIEGSTRPLTLGSFRQVDLGDDVVWGGFPLESWVPTFHKGMISFKSVLPLPRTRGDTECLQLDGTVNRGNSGGPIIDPRDGRVVAVVSSNMGGLDEELVALVKSKDQTGLNTKMVIGGVDPVAGLKKIIIDMDRHLQLGIGYGISVDYLAQLK